MKMKLCFILLIALSLAGCGASGTDTTGGSAVGTYTVSGTISTATQPLADVNVDLTDGGSTVSKKTDSKGNYSFTGLASATYGVKPTPSEYTFNPPDKPLPSIAQDQVVNFTAILGNAPPVTYTVSGKITVPVGVDVSTVKVRLNNAGGLVQEVPVMHNSTNSTDGTYSITGIVNGDYTVKPILAGYKFSPLAVTNIQSDKVLNFTASAIPVGYSISGNITLNQAALSGVNVTLSVSGIAATSTLTDASGNYSFAGLAIGKYNLTPTPTDYSFTPDKLPVEIINANLTAQNFTAKPIGSGGVVTRNYTLYIESGTLTINGTGGTTLDAWGYTDVNGGKPKFPGPQLSANDGDTVNVTVTNHHTIPHNFVINGATSGTPELIDSKTIKYSFTAVKAGSYLYYDSLNSNINREMGLYGALIVGPTDGSNHVRNSVLGNIASAYDFQRIWIVSEMDNPRWNTVAKAGGIVDTTIYKPNYFLINGQSGSDGMTNAATTIEGNVGQYALVRIINAGQFTNSLHFHGNHIKVWTVNGVQQDPIKSLDVISIPPLGTAEVMYYLNQPGVYPMHNHIAQMETSNGAYLNGIVTMITMH